MLGNPRLWSVALCAVVVLWPTLASAEGSGVEQVVARTVRSNYGALHECYRQVLAEDRRRSGTVFVQVVLGKRDTVRRARVVRDELGHKKAKACILQWVKRWTFTGAAREGAVAGNEIVLPLTFRADPTQQAVYREDAPLWRDHPGAIVRPLLNRKNVGLSRAELLFVSVSGESTLPARVGTDLLVHVLQGRGSVRVAGARFRFKVAAGCAVWVPPGVRPTFAGQLDLLQLYTRPGVSAGYLPPVKPAKFGRKPSKLLKKPRSKAGGVPMVECVGAQRPITLAGGKARVTPILHHATVEHRRAYLGLVAARQGHVLAPRLSLPPGMADAVPPERLYYIISGRAQLTCGKVASAVGPGRAVFVPADGDHQLIASGELKAVELSVPAGVEQRYIGSMKSRKSLKNKKKAQ